MNSSDKMGQQSEPPASAGGFFDRRQAKIATEATQRNLAQSVRRAYSRSFPSQHGTNDLFSNICGTAGQQGLNLVDTTINCPTKLSHFWDEWDKNGKSYAFRRDPTRPIHNSKAHRSTGFTPKGVTLTFFLGHGTKLGRLGRAKLPTVPAVTLNLSRHHEVMKILLTLFLILAVWFQTGCTQSTPSIPPINTSEIPASRETSAETRFGDTNLIEPGTRIGPIYLGTNFETASSILGKSFFDHKYEPPVCFAREVRWLVNGTDANSPALYATFLGNGKIFQLQTQLQGYETAEGVRYGDSFQEFTSKYDTRTIEAYADRGLKSNSKYVEGYSAYVVDSGQGIAFEFFKSREDKIWYISSIIVFDPREDFSKWRFCDSSEKAKWWVKLKSLDLDSTPELDEK